MATAISSGLFAEFVIASNLREGELFDQLTGATFFFSGEIERSLATSPGKIASA
jgi:hypothetical protein